MAVIANPFTSGNQGFSGNNQNQQQPNNQNQPQGAAPPNGSRQDPSDPNKRLNDPNNQGDDPNKKPEGDDPLQSFKGLWENDAEDPNNPTPKKPSVIPEIDPAKLTEMVGKIDFTKNITPEQATAIAGGGETAFAALKEILNGAIRQSFLTSFSTSRKMLETTMANAKTDFLSDVPDHVKNIMVENSLTTSNPIMKNAVYGPMVEVVRHRMQEKFPKATPTQIESSVNKYFDDMANDITKSKVTANQTTLDNKTKLAKGDPSADWETWIETELGGSKAKDELSQQI